MNNFRVFSYVLTFSNNKKVIAVNCGDVDVARYRIFGKLTRKKPQRLSTLNVHMHKM